MSNPDSFSQSRANSYELCTWHSDPLLIDWIIRQLAHFGESICDVGAGTGCMIGPLSHNFRKVVAIEPSCNMLVLLRERLREADRMNTYLCMGTAESLPLRDHALDLVFSKSSLHHCVDPKMAISEMTRVARNAIAIVEVVSPMEVRADGECMDYVKTLLLAKEPTRQPEAVFSEEGLRELVSAASRRQFMLHFDQYIDIGNWLRSGDLCTEEQQRLYTLVDEQPHRVKHLMQIHRRAGRLVQGRRMSLLIGLLS